MGKRPLAKTAAVNTPKLTSFSDFTGGSETSSASSSTEPPTAKKKFDRDNTRTIKGSWFQEFPWLELNKKDGTMLCKDCIREKKKNIFTVGKSVGEKPKKDDLQKHQKTVDHR